MTAALAPYPVFRGVNNQGLALVGGLLFTYAAGTTTPQATYVDSTQTTQNTNPVVLNSRGEANVWLDPSLTYKYVLQDSAGNPIWTVDHIGGPNSQSIIQTPYTPILVFQGGGVTFNQQLGLYSVIGSVMTFSFQIAWSGIAAPTGNLTLRAPLPAKAGGPDVAIQVGYNAGINLTTGRLSYYMPSGTNQGTFFNVLPAGTTVQVTGALFLATNGAMVITGSYQV